MIFKEFVCLDCGEIFETFEKENGKTECPKCKGSNVSTSFSGKTYGCFGKSSGGCTGNCSTCGGCKH